MTGQRSVLFLKDAGPYGYAAIAGQHALVYEVDVAYLVNLGVIAQPPEEVEPQPQEGEVAPRMSFWQKLLRR